MAGSGEFKSNFVTQKQNRWLITIVMVVGLIAFVGISLAPLVSFVFNDNPSVSGPNPSPVATANASGLAALQDQARGYAAVLEREPENPTALRGLLEAKLKLGDVAGAIPPLEKLAKLNPEQSEYAILLAQAKQQVGDLDGSAQAYRNILATRPGDTNALQGLVSLLLQQKRPEAAIGLLQDTLKAAPQANQAQPGAINVTSVQLLLGQVYSSQERYQEALAIYDEAIRTDKQDFRPVLAKAMVYKEQGRVAEAKPLFETATNLAPAQFKDQIKQLSEEGATPATEATPTPSPSPTASP